MRPVKYNIHPKEAKLADSLIVSEMPDGYTGEGFFATKLSDVVGLARKNSIWPMPFATSCCGIEFMATMASHYDLARFGSERVGFSPRQCDLLMVMGTIAKKMGPVLRQVYIQMAEPRWVMAVGACASTGGIFDTYSVLQGIDQIIPVDVYVPGCAPRPEAILDGVMRIQDIVQNESIRRRNTDHYKALLNSYGIE
ncbi:MAG TPA: NADH-quinone oxidoreductase subunit B [Chitinophagaceae bacterium]|nr:NADH-quinone oxidoreductase subunit B [Chitinophagaceae bacterium]MCC6634613.1 NADH-quinone oxidoreductase subunit B [Chitinophagaceae bacterium]HMZ45419.1 NADH-quinone oxidoreductase subunit B [Chitinophagaceae bacterium]HNE93532.1 NADH-quinone oxidoreductase subunit B [Chitinophagaceae bacterium]HNF29539.1 NADH-quinone oxidoreductase subunit B [Chitinophagaceae bacterium]